MTSAKEAENKQRHSAQRTPYMKVLKKCLPQCINVFFVFFVTLSIFPAMHSGKGISIKLAFYELRDESIMIVEN